MEKIMTWELVWDLVVYVAEFLVMTVIVLAAAAGLAQDVDRWLK